MIGRCDPDGKSGKALTRAGGFEYKRRSSMPRKPVQHSIAMTGTGMPAGVSGSVDFAWVGVGTGMFVMEQALTRAMAHAGMKRASSQQCIATRWAQKEEAGR